MTYGQSTLAQTDVAQKFSSVNLNKPFIIKALSTNTGSVFVGDLNVTSSNGFELAKSELLVFDNVSDLDDIYIVGTSGDKVCYMSLEE